MTLQKVHTEDDSFLKGPRKFACGHLIDIPCLIEQLHAQWYESPYSYCYD
jgi:hypothetical protein